MTWIETINIRLSKQEDTSEFLNIFREMKVAQDNTLDNKISIKLYQNKNIENDWAICLCHKSPEEQANKPGLGYVIIEAIRPFGLLNHSIWENKGDSPYENK